MSNEAGVNGGLEERKSELFATITLLAGVKRQIMHARGARRLELIERQAQLEADKERLSHEVNSQYMYRNLQAFMNRVDEYDAGRRQEAINLSSEIGGLRGGQSDLQAEFRDGLSSVQHTVSGLAEVVDDVQRRLSLVEQNTLATSLPAADRARLVALARTIPDLTARLAAVEAALRGDEHGD